MPTHDRGADGHRRRSQARLPRERVGRFIAKTKEKGHNASQLCHSWELLAARHAKAGRYELVPQHDPIPAGTPLANLQWTQTAEESAECVRLLREADTTVRAVLLACIDAYLDADGDALEMRWPTRERFLVGAA